MARLVRYVLLCAIRRVGLAHIRRRTCGTIRLKLLKPAGLIRISAPRIKFALALAQPDADEWCLAVPASPQRLRRRRDANKPRQPARPTAHRRPETGRSAQRGAKEALVFSRRRRASIVRKQTVEALYEEGGLAHPLHKAPKADSKC